MLLRPVRSFRLLLLVLSFGALACDLSDVPAAFGCAGKPNAVITSPPSGTPFQEGQDVSVQSISTDAKGIVRVELIVDGTTVRTDTAPGPQDKFTLVQTWKATPGTHTISVRAYNTANVASDPAAISVTVTPSIALGATPTSPSGACTNDSAFVSDVTVPDGTVLAPGQAFNKIWRVRNSGTCTWGTAHEFAFLSGEAMALTTLIAVPDTAPGVTADLLVALTAPSAPGIHSGQWRLRTGGAFFGATLNVSINVPAAPPPCPGPPVIASFTASPNPITAGGSTTLSWGLVSNATSAAIDHGIGGVATPGSKKVSPATTTTYTLTATGCGGVATSQVTVTVNPAPTAAATPTATATATVSSPTTTQILNQVSVPANSVGSATATCPGSSIVTGGGYASQTSLSTEVYTQFKSGNGWEVFLNNTTGSSQLVNAYAICLSGISGNTSQALQQGSIPASSAGSVTAPCPGGSVLTGGGFASPSGLSTKIYTQSKSGNGWEAFLNNTTGSSQLVNAYAICLSGTSATTTQILAQVSVPANSVGSATANCPGGTVLTGGGFASQSSLSTKVYTQSKSGNGWEVFLSNTTGSSQLVNAYAICASF